MTIKLRTVQDRDYEQIEELYESAFPENERAPLFLLVLRAHQGRGKMLTVSDRGRFIGFVYLVCREDIVYVFYLAITPKARGMGYGSTVMRAIQSLYSGRRIFIAREQLDKKAENYSERVKRREFYIKNGFMDIPSCIKEGNVVYDVMTTGGDISPREYDRLITGFTGHIMKLFIDMRLIRKK